MIESAIGSFSGNYRFLSNFWPAEVQYQSITFPTVEHGYVAAKSLSPAIWRYVAELERPGKAKRFGSTLQLRVDWTEVKVDIMKDLVRQKFQHPELREKLLSTGEQELIEGNSWGDTFWGVCDGKGQNWLGLILMDTRARLRRFDLA